MRLLWSLATTPIIILLGYRNKQINKQTNKNEQNENRKFRKQSSNCTQRK